MRESHGQNQVSICLHVFFLPSPSSAVLCSAVLWAIWVSVPGSTVWPLFLGRERFSQWQDHRSVSVPPPRALCGSLAVCPCVLELEEASLHPWAGAAVLILNLQPPLRAQPVNKC